MTALLMVKLWLIANAALWLWIFRRLQHDADQP